MRQLTPTSYAILGLLAIKPWTAYELAKQMEVSLRNFWPRAESKLYEEPKKLVAHGFATVTSQRTGNRSRSLYSITDEGRSALRAWLDEPGAMPSLEFEALIKVFFAEHGSKEQLVTNLERIRDGARSRAALDAHWARYYLSSGGQFPERLAVISLVGRIQAGLNHTVLEWAEWALDTVNAWPEDLHAAPPAQDALQHVASFGGSDSVRENQATAPRRSDPRPMAGHSRVGTQDH